jgi:DNA-binding HxlR family transcriptional regulator
MALLDLLGRRWTLRILWELRESALTFRELQSACEGMSSSILNERLRELHQAQILTSSKGEGYLLTESGQELLSSLSSLSDWAGRWAEHIAD